MSLELIAEVWDAMRSHIDMNDRKDAADTLINLLIDNDFEANDIKQSFRGDKDIAEALKYYAQQHDTEEEDDDFYDEDAYDDWE